MKKHISLLAFAAAVVAAGLNQVHAQTFPVGNPATSIVLSEQNADGSPINASGADPAVITVSGAIPEHIQFTHLDDQLEFGDFGGGPFVGDAYSYNGAHVDPATGTSNNSNTTAGAFFSTPDGRAGVQFRSNTYVIVQGRAEPLLNIGPDGQEGTADDHVLSASYNLRYRGRAKRFTSPVVTDGTVLTDWNGFTNSNTNTGGLQKGYNGFNSWTAFSKNEQLLPQYIFSPGALFAAPYDTSGLIIGARVKRNGVADRKGEYKGNINMSYYKL
jgi:hypothetical protein